MKTEVLVPQNVQEIISDVVRKTKCNKQIVKIILYGSYSKGDYNEESDVDIAFFIGNHHKDIKPIYSSLLKLCSAYDIDIQPQVFHVRELEEPVGIIEEIVEFGTDITDVSFWSARCKEYI